MRASEPTPPGSEAQWRFAVPLQIRCRHANALRRDRAAVLPCSIPTCWYGKRYSSVRVAQRQCRGRSLPAAVVDDKFNEIRASTTRAHGNSFLSTRLSTIHFELLKPTAARSVSAKLACEVASTGSLHLPCVQVGAAPATPPATSRACQNKSVAPTGTSPLWTHCRRSSVVSEVTLTHRPIPRSTPQLQQPIAVSRPPPPP